MDDILSKLIVDTMTPLITESLSYGARLVSRGVVKAKHIRDFNSLYAAHLIQKYANIRIFGATKPLAFDSMYTQVKLREDLLHRQYRSIEELKEGYSVKERKYTLELTRKTGDQVILRERNLAVLGGPGSGKTTFLQYAALQSARGKLGTGFFPIFVTLKDFGASDRKLLNYIIEQNPWNNEEEATSIVKGLLLAGKCMLLLDGLDEVNKSDLSLCITRIHEFFSHYGNNKYILSCRIADYEQNFDFLTDVEICDFDDDQIKLFVNNYFDSEELATNCYEAIVREGPLGELCRRPLTLGMLCLVYDERREFPISRAELYSDTLDVLLVRWDAKKSISREEVYRCLTKKRKEDMLSRIAANTFEYNKIFMQKEYLVREIEKYLDNIPAIREKFIEVDGEKVLKNIEVNHGILVEQARNIYKFAHLSFHEYYVSRYILNNMTERLLLALIGGHIFDPKWQEIFILVGSSLDDADFFFSEFKRAIDNKLLEDNAVFKFVSEGFFGQYQNTNYKMNTFLRAATLADSVNVNQWVFSDSVGEEHEKEGYFSIKYNISEIMSFFGHDLDYILCSEGDQNYRPDKPSALVPRKDIHKYIKGYAEKELDIYLINTIPAELLKAICEDRSSFNCLKQYIFATRLFVQCLFGQIYISRELWNQLIDKILVPPM